MGEDRLASVGLEVLGLGPIDSPTLGMTLYWVNFNAALINGWWWWWAAPLVIRTKPSNHLPEEGLDAPER